MQHVKTDYRHKDQGLPLVMVNVFGLVFKRSFFVVLGKPLALIIMSSEKM